MEIMPATIVSGFPISLVEKLPGVFPAEFHIPAGGICVIDKPVQFIYRLDGESLRVPVDPMDLARSIIRDYTIASHGTILGVAEPALVALEGVVSLDDVRSAYMPLMEAAKNRQRVWFKRLADLADDEWQRTRQHRAITDLQRIAGRTLKLEREWLDEVKNELISCKACKSSISISAIVCPSCSVVLDVEKYSSFQFANQAPQRVGK